MVYDLEVVDCAPYSSDLSPIFKSLEPLKTSWLATDLHQTPTWSKLLPPSYRRLTPIYSTPGYNPWWRDETDAYMLVVSTWKSDVYHFATDVDMEVRIKFSASECLLPYILKLFLT
jgi:hypothetical protein